MEATKGVIFDRGKVGDNLNSYLVCFVIVTDKKLTNTQSETIAAGSHRFTEPMIDSIESMDKYKPPYNLGDVSGAIIEVSKMNPDDLEKIVPRKKP